jgi:hypothetical protein
MKILNICSRTCHLSKTSTHLVREGNASLDLNLLVLTLKLCSHFDLRRGSDESFPETLQNSVKKIQGLARPYLLLFNQTKLLDVEFFLCNKRDGETIVKMCIQSATD